jgi:pyruvate formate lyase activating enzyme
MQAALCAETARLLKEQGINVAVDTSGYVKREALDAIIPYTDTFLFDVKAMDEAVHLACTGVSNRLILENIRYADSRGVPMEIRYPYVPTMNDGEADAIGRFVSTLKNLKLVRVLPYHSYAQNKYACLGREYPLPDVPVPTDEEIEAALKAIRAYGVRAERF